MFKNKLKYYFAQEILKSYLFVLAILTLLIWVTQSARLLYLITETGLSISVYLKYILLILPKIISKLMLVSFVVSIFLSITKFQNNKEIEIYWLSGISKMEIVAIIIKISLLILAVGWFFFIYFVPFNSGKSRTVLTNSEFSLVNSLVKKNNFNSPLKGLTIFVKKNDNMGNLEKVYIFENNKTIISKKGRVLNSNGKNYLELTDGLIHEKNLENKIVEIKFKKTLFDFTKYQTKIITKKKHQEISFLEIVEEYKSENNKNNKSNLLYEIHKRIFTPLFIPVIAILCSFIIYSNNEKYSANKIKAFIFSSSILSLILLEVLLNLSVTNVFFRYFLYVAPIVFSFSLLSLLNNFLKNEPIVK